MYCFTSCLGFVNTSLRRLPGCATGTVRHCLICRGQLRPPEAGKESRQHPARLLSALGAVPQGIALQADPDYSIVKECLPYLARRLLTDDSPRARQALKVRALAGGGCARLLCRRAGNI